MLFLNLLYHSEQRRDYTNISMILNFTRNQTSEQDSFLQKCHSECLNFIFKLVNAMSVNKNKFSYCFRGNSHNSVNIIANLCSIPQCREEFPSSCWSLIRTDIIYFLNDYNDIKISYRVGQIGEGCNKINIQFFESLLQLSFSANAFLALGITRYFFC